MTYKVNIIFTMNVILLPEQSSHMFAMFVMFAIGLGPV